MPNSSDWLRINSRIPIHKLSTVGFWFGCIVTRIANMRLWDDPAARLRGVRRRLDELAKVAGRFSGLGATAFRVRLVATAMKPSG